MQATKINLDPLTAASATLILILAISVWGFGWTVDWGQILPTFGLLAALVLAGVMIRRLSIENPRIQKIVHKAGNCWCMISLFILLVITGSLTCSVLASAGFPYVDGLLHAADQALGFNWKNLLYILLQNEKILEHLSKAYASIGTQQLSIIVLLCLLRPEAYIFRFMLAWLLTLTATALLFPFFPAVAAFDYYQIERASIPVPTAEAGWDLTSLLERIRSGADNTLNLDKLTGPVTMPSLHAAASVLFAHALWTFSYLRWPALVLNCAMWFSSLTIGAHYLVDLLAGSIIALFCIKTAELAYPDAEAPAES